MNMFSRKSAVVIMIAALGVSEAAAQYSNSQSGSQRNRARLATSYFNTRGGAYNPAYSSYQLSPYMNYRAPIIATPALPPVGPVERYSEIEYGEIVKMAMDAARENTPTVVTGNTRTSIVDQTTASMSGGAAYKPVATSISDVLNRGILLLPTGEEMRLRGVSMPSTTDRHEVARIYAKEGVQLLRNVTQGKEVYVILDDPLRDGDGRLLGSVILADGTELNRLILEMGYGSLKQEDFATGVDFSDLRAWQQTAQQNRLGVWSKGY